MPAKWTCVARIRYVNTCTICVPAIRNSDRPAATLSTWITVPVISTSSPSWLSMSGPERPPGRAASRSASGSGRRDGPEITRRLGPAISAMPKRKPTAPWTSTLSPVRTGTECGGSSSLSPPVPSVM